MKNRNKKEFYLLATVFAIAFIGFFVSIAYVKWHGSIMIYPAFISLIIMLGAGWSLDKLLRDNEIKKFKDILKYLEKNHK
ncbi:hypothetical protein [Staphylococcus chromogenes]|uniref:hypothetical protein n=1 Tax=Staphylococcus chromogenes TaxID=46126 RepID=UPI002883F3A4|nr:hypothetical protein [Staphylococcus chromogenes]MDT0656338.1 hypothetical protein [Staphylococcus chromogenes]MDT0672758.1 hypothetical protein [Staphylococcus chromogenes]MDT0674926.1 hypothetical protein [Staphylococcus chromogenes]MDT0699128.1 hypothetical protein [Staphylococcus chromogenes]